MHYTYVLQSKKDNKWYTGATDNLRKRLFEHNNNLVRATKGRGPFEVIYYESCIDKHDAFIREKYLKTGMGKRYISNRLKRFLSLTGQAPQSRVYPVRSKSPLATAEPLARTSNGGFSTLEVLIAMTILILAVVAAVVVSFGNQSLLADSQANTEALNKAQALLENVQALARKDFNLVNPVAETNDDIFKKKVDVQVLSDHFTKKVIATVSWKGEHNRNLSVSLNSLVTNFENYLGGNTCSSVLSGAWNPPPTTNFTMPANSYNVTDVDAYQAKLYAGTDATLVASADTFFVFDISNPALPPQLISSIDTNPTTSTGVAALQVDGKYAYVANARSIATTDPTFGQLQIIDITANPPVLVKAYAVPGVAGGAGQGVGKSIFYKDGYVYLGLTTGAGHEFNVIDVHDVNNPFLRGSYTVGSAVNKIFVNRGYAYIASPNTRELITVNVSNPASPTFAGGFDAPGGSGNGKSLAVVGDTMYLGRTVGGTEFYILDNKIPATAQLPIFGSRTDIDDSINDLIVRDNLAFLLKNSNLQILDISNSALPIDYSTLGLGGANKGNNMDCEGNFLYIAASDTTGLTGVIIKAGS